LIDGFRYGFIGQAEGDLTVGVILSIVLTVIVGWVAYEVFRRGWRLKS
jgi:ABC-2 type transport system permease protein